MQRSTTNEWFDDCNGPVKLDTKLLFESVDDYDVFDHWASNSAGVR